MNGYIKIVMTRLDGSRSEAKIKEVTQPMVDAVDAAIYTMMTGKRYKPAKKKAK